MVFGHVCVVWMFREGYYIHSLAIHVVNFLPQLLSPLPDISVVKSLQLLGWSAACGDISLAQDASIIHQYFLKVVL